MSESELEVGQRELIAAVKEGSGSPEALAALATLRGMESGLGGDQVVAFLALKAWHRARLPETPSHD